MKIRTISEASMDDLIGRIERHQILGAHECALESAKVLRAIISSEEWTTIGQLRSLVRSVGNKAANDLPSQLTVANVFWRMLHMIKEELTIEENTIEDIHVSSESELKDRKAERSRVLKHITSDQNIHATDEHESVSASEVRDLIEQALDNYVDEIYNAYDYLGSFADQLVQSGDVVLAFGLSKSLTDTLKSVISFTKIIFVQPTKVISSPNTISIALDQVFSFMPRVTKVLIGVWTVTIDGKFTAPAGSSLILQAARYFNVTVATVAPNYKITPLQFHERMIEYVSPQKVIAYEKFVDLPYENTAICKATDVIDAKYVNYCLGNTGIYSPNQLRKVCADEYII